MNKNMVPKKITQIKEFNTPSLWLINLTRRSCKPHRAAAIIPKIKDKPYFFLKNGMRNTRQATKKNTDPNIDQNEPTLATTNPSADITNSIHPIKFIWLSVIHLPLTLK